MNVRHLAWQLRRLRFILHTRFHRARLRYRVALRQCRWFIGDVWGRRVPTVPTSHCYFLRLGVPLDASTTQVADAYARIRTRKLHPAAQKLVDEAYAVLSDTSRRELYLLTRRALSGHGLGADPLAATLPLRTSGFLTRVLVRLHNFFVR